MTNATTTYKVRIRCGATVHYDYIEATENTITDRACETRARHERLYNRSCTIASVSKARTDKDGYWK